LTLVVYATYVSYTYKGSGDISDRKNYDAKYHNAFHRGKMHVVLSEYDIDEHITLSAGEIDNHIEGYLKEGSGKILLHLEIIFIKAYTYQ
jgi:hypothetical protein